MIADLASELVLSGHGKDGQRAGLSACLEASGWQGSGDGGPLPLALDLADAQEASARDRCFPALPWFSILAADLGVDSFTTGHLP